MDNQLRVEAIEVAESRHNLVENLVENSVGYQSRLQGHAPTNTRDAFGDPLGDPFSLTRSPPCAIILIVFSVDSPSAQWYASDLRRSFPWEGLWLPLS